MTSTRTKTDWYRTGDVRIVPWWFGLMRAEFMERRDFKCSQTGDPMEYQIRWVSAGRLPMEFDGAGAFGFWSTLATPYDDKRYGDRRIWHWFIRYWDSNREAK